MNVHEPRFHMSISKGVELGSAPVPAIECILVRSISESELMTIPGPSEIWWCWVLVWDSSTLADPDGDCAAQVTQVNTEPKKIDTTARTTNSLKQFAKHAEDCPVRQQEEIRCELSRCGWARCYREGDWSRSALSAAVRF